MSISRQQMENRIRQQIALDFGGDWSSFIDARIDIIVTKVITALIDKQLEARVLDILIKGGFIDQINRNIQL